MAIFAWIIFALFRLSCLSLFGLLAIFPPVFLGGWCAFGNLDRRLTTLIYVLTGVFGLLLAISLICLSEGSFEKRNQWIKWIHTTKLISNVLAAVSVACTYLISHEITLIGCLVANAVITAVFHVLLYGDEEAAHDMNWKILSQQGGCVIMSFLSKHYGALAISSSLVLLCWVLMLSGTSQLSTQLPTKSLLTHVQTKDDTAHPVASDTVDSDTVDSDTVDSDTVDSDTVDSDTVDSDTRLHDEGSDVLNKEVVEEEELVGPNVKHDNNIMLRTTKVGLEQHELGHATQYKNEEMKAIPRIAKSD